MCHVVVFNGVAVRCMLLFVVVLLFGSVCVLFMLTLVMCVAVTRVCCCL